MKLKPCTHQKLTTEHGCEILYYCIGEIALTECVFRTKIFSERFNRRGTPQTNCSKQLCILLIYGRHHGWWQCRFIYRNRRIIILYCRKQCGFLYLLYRVEAKFLSKFSTCVYIYIYIHERGSFHPFTSEGGRSGDGVTV